MTRANWQTARLGDVLRLRYGKALSKAERDPAGAFPVIGSAGTMARTYSPLVREPCLVIGRKGNVGQSHFASNGAWPTDTTFFVTMPPSIDVRFLQYQLDSLDLRRLDSSTATPSLRRQDLEAQVVALPPLPEQRRIVNILADHLSRLDAADAYLSVAASRSEALHAHVLTSALAEVTTREYRFADLLATPLANGRSVPTQDGGFPVLRLTALRGDRIDLGERKAGAWTHSDAEPHLVQRGDFLISRGNGSLHLVGRGGLVDEDPDPVAYPDTLIRARPNESLISAKYLSLAWNSALIRSQIVATARTTAGIYKVNQQDLGAVRVAVPSLSDQADIVSRVNGQRSALERLNRERLRAIGRGVGLRRSILAAAFSGRLTGKHSDLDRAHEMAGA